MTCRPHSNSHSLSHPALLFFIALPNRENYLLCAPHQLKLDRAGQSWSALSTTVFLEPRRGLKMLNKHLLNTSCPFCPQAEWISLLSSDTANRALFPNAPCPAWRPLPRHRSLKGVSIVLFWIMTLIIRTSYINCGLRCQIKMWCPCSKSVRNFKMEAAEHSTQPVCFCVQVLCNCTSHAHEVSPTDEDQTSEDCKYWALDLYFVI